MTMRAKFYLEAVVPQTWRGVKAIFRTNYDPTIAEDQRFTKATPSGTVEMVIDNPAAISQLTIGAYYYADFERIEPENGNGS